MGITAKEDVATGKVELQDSNDKVFGTRTIQFAHKFTGGETGVDLLSLTTPPELLANGFVNASPAEIAASHLSVFKKNLRVSLSRGPSGLELKPFGHYVVSGNRINFVGNLLNSGGAQAGEILFGEIVTVPTNSIVVGDMRCVRGTVPVIIGQQLVPIPYPFKVGVNLSQGQAGDIKIKKQGVTLYRNTGNATAAPSADGNFQEIDAGNGYGVSIMLNTPALTNFLLEYEVGFQISSGDASMWAALESFEGALLALAGDAAYNFYGDTNLSRYIATSASALERRAFGDLITALKLKSDTLLAENLSTLRQYDRTAFVPGTNSWSCTRAMLIPYTTLDGAWRLRFNIRGTSSAASVQQITVTGATFKNAYTAGQAFAVSYNGGTLAAPLGNALPNTSTLQFAASTTGTDWQCSGDVELESKPTWVP